MPPRRRATSNPAQRLYEILERHHAELGRGTGASGLWAVWSAVLGVPQQGVVSQFAGAFALIPDIERALRVTGDEHQQRQCRIHSGDWAKAFTPGSSGTQQQVNDGDTSDVSRAALGGIASHLRDNLSEGVPPSVEGATALRDIVLQAIDEVLADDALPLQVQDLLLRRLHDALWALDHVELMGADGIAAACDRLAMVYAWVNPDAGEDKSGVWETVKSVMIGGYALIGFADTAYGGYQAWTAIEPYVTKAIGG